MKEEQLMINDIVTIVVTTYNELTDKEEISSHPARITDISPTCRLYGTDDNCYIYANFLDGFNSEFYDYEIEPIPLSEEILNANEWYNNGHDYYTYKGTKLRTNLWLIDKVLNESNVIESVHEFQHLLRLCKRDDMADNFKLPQL